MAHWDLMRASRLWFAPLEKVMLTPLGLYAAKAWRDLCVQEDANKAIQENIHPSRRATSGQK